MKQVSCKHTEGESVVIGHLLSEEETEAKKAWRESLGDKNSITVQGSDMDGELKGWILEIV